MNLPGLDVAALIENQKRNIDAMSKAAEMTNKAATEISHWQLEMFRAASEQLAATLKDIKLSNEQRRDIAIKAFENASARAKEYAETTAVSNREMFDAAKQRMTENFEEIRNMFSKTKG
jgi:hypothetical protein